MDQKYYTITDLQKEKHIALGTLIKRFRSKDYEKWGIKIRPFKVMKKCVSEKDYQKYWSHLSRK